MSSKASTLSTRSPKTSWTKSQTFTKFPNSQKEQLARRTVPIVIDFFFSAGYNALEDIEKGNGERPAYAPYDR
jgi:hypothetical protein